MDEAQSSTAAQQEIRAQREGELAALKRTLEEETEAHANAISSMRQKHAQQMEELSDALEAAKRVSSCHKCCGVSEVACAAASAQAKQALEKAKAEAQSESEALQVELRDMTTAYQESDKRRKNAEAGLSEAQAHITEDTGRLQDLSSQNDRMKVGDGGGRRRRV